MIYSRYLLAGDLVLAAAACGVEQTIELPPAWRPSVAGAEHLAGTPITLEDEVRMVRIEDYYGYNGRWRGMKVPALVAMRAGRAG